MTIRRKPRAEGKTSKRGKKAEPGKRTVGPRARTSKTERTPTPDFSARLTDLLSALNALSKSADVDDLCRAAVEYAMRGIGFDRASIWFFDDERLTQVGTWGVDIEGRLQDERNQRIPVDCTPVQAILESREPVVFIKVDELRNERAEVVGRGNHLMAGLWNGEQAIGFFSADNLITRRPIMEEDRELLGLFAISIAHLCTLKRAEERIKADIREKELMVRETNHRVKNNMQIIASLLSLQARHAEDPAVLRMFRESRLRIQAMAQVHEMLYASNVPAMIDFGRYVETLVEKLKVSFGTEGKGIAFIFETESVFLDADAAVPCGLIVQELISNVLKYAFPDGWKGKPSVRIRIRQSAGECELAVRDNGIGIPDSVDFDDAGTLGLSLVRMLGRDQLKGRVDVKRDAGAEFRIRFPMKGGAAPEGAAQ
jgi:two-component sensor histidine kinase